MSLALDAIILFAVVFIIWSAARRGFVRAVMNLISTFASFVVAYVYTPKVAEFINGKFILTPIAEDIHTTLKSLARNTSTDLFDLDKLAVDVPAPLVNILDRYNVNLNEFLDKIRGLVDCSEETVYGYAEEIAVPTASAISSVLAFVGLFLVAVLVIKAITELLDYIFMLPSLKAANTVLGVVFGVIEAASVACVLAMSLSILIDVMGSIDPELFGADVVERTMLCKHLKDIDLFSKFHDVLG